MGAWLNVAAAVSPRDELRHFNEFIGSWPVQVAMLVIYALVAWLAYSKALRTLEDRPGRRRTLALVLALGVFVVLEVVLGSSMMGSAILPMWFQVVVLLWLTAMLLYYLLRFATAQRRGRGDDETRRRGEALDAALTPRRSGH